VCLEIYCPNQKIEIPFEDERIEFVTPLSITGTYTILVRNSGDKPIDRLCWLYPRKLLPDPEGIEPTGSIEVEPAGSIEDVTGELPQILKYRSEVSDGELKLFVPDPNEPEKDLDNIVGKWDSSQTLHELVLPTLTDSEWDGVRDPKMDYDERNDQRVFNGRDMALMNSLGYTLLFLRLNSPLAAGDSQWFSWRIKTVRVGENVPSSVAGPHVFHSFASPVYVHRAVKESYLSALEDFSIDDEYHTLHLPHFQKIVEVFQLRSNRLVNLRFHLLTIEPGDPDVRSLTFWHPTGDLRMLSGSPEVVVTNSSAGVECEAPVFVWKSGSILEPHNHQNETGFMLRIVVHYLSPAEVAV
jgi:hypothetical protein